MPIMHIHLVEDQYSDEQVDTLLREACQVYADGLECPMDRVRVFIQMYKLQYAAVAGVPVSESGTVAGPYFHFLVLEGRSKEQRQNLLIAFTDLIERVLNVERKIIRGGVVPILPENWGIGGVPADVMRQKEIAARAQAEQAQQ